MLVVCMNIKMGGYDSKFKWKNAYVHMRIQMIFGLEEWLFLLLWLN